MLYLSQMLGRPVVDSLGVEVGRVSDIAVQTGEVFPRITSFAFSHSDKTPFMVSWRKYVETFNGEEITLNVPTPALRFSYLQPDEILLARDLLNKQIVDVQGLKVVRVNDLKISQSPHQLRLLGAETGMRGLLRSLAPWLERAFVSITKAVGRPLQESIIAWNYMELVDRDLSAVQLSMTHKRLHELHPADVADILEQLNPQQRTKVFDHLDAQQAAETMSELDDEYQADMIDDMAESEASELLATMDPDDAADILGDLPYEKAEKLLWLMGVQDSRRIRTLLGYREKTAGGIMTPDFIAVEETASVHETIEKLRTMSEQLKTVHYVYTTDTAGRLVGALSMRALVLAASNIQVGSLAVSDLITVNPDTDQEEVAETISKYDLLAVPVVDEKGKLLGIVTVDDALDVIEEERDEDLQIAGAATGGRCAVGELYRRAAFAYASYDVVYSLGGCYVYDGALRWAPTFVSALILTPFVLLITDAAVNFATGDLLSYSGSGSGKTLKRLFGRNAFLALAVAVFGLLLAFGLAQSVFGGALGVGSLPAILTAVVVLLSSVFITVYGRSRLDKGKEISNTTTTFIMMILALVLQFALTYLFYHAVTFPFFGLN